MINEILSRLKYILGEYKLNSSFTQADFYCPFCNHHKKKLSINIENGLWHCWVCQNTKNSKGNIFQLLKKLRVDRETFDFFAKNFNNAQYFYIRKEKPSKLSLPKEYVPLTEPLNNKNFHNALYYLRKRGINDDDIFRYKIGFCESGEYAGRIIIPSYDKYFNLNYFVARSIYNEKFKYKNPNVSKNIISFEHLLDWNFPVIICEGYFDAIAIRRNAVPIMGKFLPDILLEEIFMNRNSEIVLCLDNDALNDSIEIYKFLYENGVNVSICYLDEKDPSEVGFKVIQERLNDRKKINLFQILKSKIKNDR